MTSLFDAVIVFRADLFFRYESPMAWTVINVVPTKSPNVPLASAVQSPSWEHDSMAVCMIVPCMV